MYSTTYRFTSEVYHVRIICPDTSGHFDMTFTYDGGKWTKTYHDLLTKLVCKPDLEVSVIILHTYLLRPNMS